MNDFSTDSCSDEDTVIHGENSKYLYLPDKFYSNTVAALIDTGSSVNFISSELYNSIPHKLKTSINTYTRDTLMLANAQKISVVGTATIQVSVNNERHKINVYILTIRVITKLPNSEQSYKGKVKTHKYINRQNQSTTGKL